MPELQTREQALAYLAEYSSTESFQLYPFQYGWVVVTQLSQEDMVSGRGLGLAKMALDRETGQLFVYPSWSVDMVIEAFTEMKQTGVNRVARQVYPYQERVHLRLIRETAETVEYEMTVTSLTDPPKPTEQRAVTLQKNSGMYSPTDSTAALANSYVRWVARNNQGIWPEEVTKDD